jgi:hypothetical protein
MDAAADRDVPLLLSMIDHLVAIALITLVEPSQLEGAVTMHGNNVLRCIDDHKEEPWREC